MFIFTSGPKEKIVSTGAIFACCVLIALSVKWALAGSYSLILSLGSIVLLVAILRGNRIAYWTARFVSGLSAILFASCLINPLVYDDVPVDKIWDFLLKAIMLSALTAFLYYCLGEHSKLRRLK